MQREESKISTEYEVFGGKPACKYSGTEVDPAGGYDVTCERWDLIGTLFCHSRCEQYEPKTETIT